MLRSASSHPLFGTGSFEVLSAENPSVLAFLRAGCRATDVVLCVNNLAGSPSRWSCTAAVRGQDARSS